MRLRVWSSAATLRIAAGEYRMKAKEFNATYKVGSAFHHACPALRGSRMVKTVDIARDFNCGVIVEINLEPYFANIKSLKPAG